MNQLYEYEKANHPDHVATPRYVVEDIYSLIGIEKFNQIWFPFNNYDSEFKLKAEELKLQYKATHIFDDEGNNFFYTNPPSGCDLMITNPPFGEQQRIIERSFSLIDNGLIRSFALLLPLSTLETPGRANVWEQYKDKLSIIVFKKRIKFKGCTNQFNKGVCWMCYNIDGLPSFSWI